MKKLIYIAIILLGFNSCKAQDNKKMDEKIIIPEVTKKFETFDIEEFHINNKSRFDKILNDTHTIYTGDKKNSDIKSGFSKKIYYENSVFFKIKNYYPNGNIEIKGLRFNNGSEYSIWYEFDEKGKLIKETNTDVGYDFGWDKIIQYCDNNSITLEKGYPKQGGIKTEIYKNDDDGNKVWEISYYDYKKEQYLGITLDGKTGKLLKEQVLEFEGN